MRALQLRPNANHLRSELLLMMNSPGRSKEAGTRMSMRRLGLGRGRTGTLGSRTAGMAEALKMGAATAEITPLIATEHQTGRGPRGILEAGADGIERGEIMAIGAAGSGDPRETELQPDLQVPPGLRRLHGPARLRLPGDLHPGLRRAPGIPLLSGRRQDQRQDPDMAGVRLMLPLGPNSMMPSQLLSLLAQPKVLLNASSCRRSPEIQNMAAISEPRQGAI